MDHEVAVVDQDPLRVVETLDADRLRAATSLTFASTSSAIVRTRRTLDRAGDDEGVGDGKHLPTSRMTVSSPFLSSAALAAIRAISRTCRGWPSIPLESSAASVQTPFTYAVEGAGVDQELDRSAVGQPLAQVRRRDGERGSRLTLAPAGGSSPGRVTTTTRPAGT